jgi:phenylacetate-CoA ligase
MTKAVLPYGKKGRIVITSYSTHPFIRYDIGDIGILDEKTLQRPFAAINRTNK